MMSLWRVGVRAATGWLKGDFQSKWAHDRPLHHPRLEQRRNAAARFFRERAVEPFLQNGLIDTRRCNRGAETHDHDHGEREQNAPAQLRYLDRI